MTANLFKKYSVSKGSQCERCNNNNTDIGNLTPSKHNLFGT